MSKAGRQRPLAVLLAGALLLLGGCVPVLNEEISMFLCDLSREALAAFLF